MAIEKKMDESDFGKVVKEINAFGEVIRSRQDQKQIIMDDFKKERARYKAGKIPKKTLISSVPRVRKELKRLNKDIKKNIRALQRVANHAKEFAARQDPKQFIVAPSGITLGGKKKTHRRK